jgi:hypothetical protein
MGLAGLGWVRRGVLEQRCPVSPPRAAAVGRKEQLAAPVGPRASPPEELQGRGERPGLRVLRQRVQLVWQQRARQVWRQPERELQAGRPGVRGR